jgi:hypothetical protein
MRNRIMCQIVALVSVLVFSAIIFAQTAQPSGAVKGQMAAPTPDLSGVWSRYPGGGPSRNFLSDPKTEPPMTPWAEEKYRAIKPSYQGPTGYRNDPVINCFPPGIPRIYLVDLQGVMEIIQISGRVIMLFEFDHYVRQIYTDGREHNKDLPPLWMGDSIGKWDGDTLVVDTTGFNDKTRVDKMGHPHSEALHIVERFRRVDHDNLKLEITIEDPKAYTKPWGGQLSFQLEPNWNLAESVCEDNATFDDFSKQSTGK